MAADIDIVNTALRSLGEIPLLALSDPSENGRLANATYADIRDALLREFPWNFALKRVSISANAEAPEWGYDRSFNLPGDYLRLEQVFNDSRLEWRIEGLKIVTDIGAPLKILYVARVVEGNMDPAFRAALSARLAMDWAEAISQTTSVVQQMSALYRNKLGVARIADGQTDKVRTIDADAFILVR